MDYSKDELLVFYSTIEPEQIIFQRMTRLSCVASLVMHRLECSAILVYPPSQSVVILGTLLYRSAVLPSTECFRFRGETGIINGFY